MDVLTAYVREHAPWQGDAESDDKQEEPAGEASAKADAARKASRPPADIAAILDVLRRRKRSHETDEDALNLSDCDLRPPLDLGYAQLSGGILVGANLSGTLLMEADARNTLFVGADMHGANVMEGDFRDSTFISATMTDVYAPNADFRGALFEDAKLDSADLTDADLRAADLESASLRGADLTRALLRGANLHGADLTDVKGLTRDQLADADTDDKTTLPEGLRARGAASGEGS